MCISSELNIMGKSLQYFADALRYDKEQPLAIDASIHRFEFSVDLSWKVITSCLLQEGIKTSTPRECLKQAFLANWINNDTKWLRMLQDKILAPSSYNSDIAKEIYQNLSSYYFEMKQLHDFLTNRFLNF